MSSSSSKTKSKSKSSMPTTKQSSSPPQRHRQRQQKLSSPHPLPTALPFYAITGLTHLLTASEASHILGQANVRALVKVFLRFIASNSSINNSSNRGISSRSSNNNNCAKSSSHDRNENGNSIHNEKFHSSISFRHFSENIIAEDETEEERYWIDLIAASLSFDFSNCHCCSNEDDEEEDGGEELENSGNNNNNNNKRKRKVPLWCETAWHRMLNLPPRRMYTNLYQQQQKQQHNNNIYKNDNSRTSPSATSSTATTTTSTTSALTPQIKFQNLNSQIPTPILGLDKSKFLRAGILFPQISAPHAEKDGHLVLMEYFFLALATPSSTLTVNRLARICNPIPTTVKNQYEIDYDAVRENTINSNSSDGSGGGINLRHRVSTLYHDNVVNTEKSFFASTSSTSSSTTATTKTTTKKSNHIINSINSINNNMTTDYNITGMNEHLATKSIILLPDLIIFWAISMNYHSIHTSKGVQERTSTSSTTTSTTSPPQQQQKPTEEDQQQQKDNPSSTSSSWQLTPFGIRSINHATEIVFRIYNSFHKKGVLSRETLNQFMNDIYGNDATERHRKRVHYTLDQMFMISYNSSSSGGGSTQNHHPQHQHPHAPTRYLAHLNRGQFMHAVQRTIHILPSSSPSLSTELNHHHPTISVEHKVIDWVMHLGILPFFIVQNHQFYHIASLPTQQLSSSLITEQQQQNHHNNHLNMYTYLQAKMEMLRDVTMDMEYRKLCRKFGMVDNVHGIASTQSPNKAVNGGSSAGTHTNTSTSVTKGATATSLGTDKMQLYEVKRRFRSVVEMGKKTSSDRKTKDALKTCDGDEDADAYSNDAGSTRSSVSDGEEGHDLPIDETEGDNHSNDLVEDNDDSQPKNVINEETFLQATSERNSELGHGGFLTPSLAKLVFQAGCCTIRKNQDQFSREKVDELVSSIYVDFNGTDDVEQEAINGNHYNYESTEKYWTLYDVLSFGCHGVRSDLVDDKKEYDALLRFVFSMCLLVPKSNEQILGNVLPFVNIPSSRHVGAKKHADFSMTRYQVGYILILLMDHAIFRQIVDSPSSQGNTEQRGFPIEKLLETNKLEDIQVDSSIALNLFLSKRDMSDIGIQGGIVSLTTLIDWVFKNGMNGIGAIATQSQHLTYQGFVNWCTISNFSLIRSLLIDLKLIASILFGVKPSSPQMEKTLIDEISHRYNTQFPTSDFAKRGPPETTWYVVPSNWWRKWESFVAKSNKEGELSNPPSFIANNNLLNVDGSLALRPNLRNKQDFELLPPLAWSALQAWYDGGPPIARTVVPFVRKLSTGTPYSKDRDHIHFEVDLYPLFVTVFLLDSKSGSEARPFQQYVPVSRYLPLRELLRNLCRSLDVKEDNGRLRFATTKPRSHLEDSGFLLNLEKSLIDQAKKKGIMKNGDEIDTKKLELILELKIENRDWPTESKGQNDSVSQQARDDSLMGDGIVGLHNMGNTCYMNSSIQCISHTPLLREYFTSKAYLNDINRINPLGYQGRLAQVSAVLINTLWRRNTHSILLPQKRLLRRQNVPISGTPCVTPRTFKETLGRLNEDFFGNEQHDAQELLAFLLSGLSEDLNRIMEKPYIEAPDSDGRPDKELADIWWSNHLKREFSIIVALFTGQYKSLLTCSSCKYESARFEPFCFMQLPLPEDDQVAISILFFPFNSDESFTNYSIRVKSDGTLKDLLINFTKILHFDRNGGAQENEKDDENYDSDCDSQTNSDPNYQLYKQMANNLAIISTDQGCIKHILPDHWKVTKTFNKDTGEPILLHVYELERSEVETKNQLQKHTDQDEAIDGRRENLEEKEGLKHSFIAMCQRKPDLMNRPFLHFWTQRVFGNPFLLRVADLEGYSGRDFYDLVGQRVKSYVPHGVLKFLSQNQSRPHIFDTEEDTRQGGMRMRRQECNETHAYSEETVFGSIPRYGFRLRITSRDGKKCNTCPWYKSCVGSLIPDDHYPTIVADGDTVSVDWHIAVDLMTDSFGKLLPSLNEMENNKTLLQNVKRHYSCRSGYARSKNSITLEECLQEFTKEEKIPEAYCSKCKEFRVQTKAMSVWRLPPVMIIHLKRFQFNQQIKRKLREKVHFPVEGLDFSQVIATCNKTDSIVAPEDQHTKGGEKLESDPFESVPGSLYDLYAVVHHHGALSGGHYVASLKSEIDGKWRLFNDAQIYDISTNQLIDASAYILFYVRRDIPKSSLEDFWDTRPREGEGMTEEEVEKMMKGRDSRCSIQ